MRGRSIIPSEGVIQFTRILDELKSSIIDLMNVADNMIPEDVLNKGLTSYITKICKELENNSLKIDIEVSNEFDSLPEDVVINLYKIFKSLVQYLLNYTQAAEISVIFSIQNNIIMLQEIDDGKSFNLSALSYPGFDNLAEIKSIVDRMRGNFSIQRKDYKNETNITFPL